jgi:tRNA (guanine37-N1)-methyltransferase
MNFHVLTLFPDMITGAFSASILGKAQHKGLLHLHTVNIRDYTLDRHQKVDDYPYGGGAGMLMQAQPVFDAWKSLGGKKRTIYLSPQGKPFTQKIAKELAKEDELVFLCGHYEGIDERVLEEIVTDYVSIGDYILTGGELPALVMMDAIARLVPGVLHNHLSAQGESFHNDLLEYPQYSRPEIWEGKRVPEVLLSGDQRRIRVWQREQAIQRTAAARPDLYTTYLQKEAAVKRLKRYKRENIHLIEAMERGSGEVIYESDASLLLYLQESRICLLGGIGKMRSDDADWLSAIPEQAMGIWIPNIVVNEAESIGKTEDAGRNTQILIRNQLQQRFAYADDRNYCLASYTMREKLPWHSREIFRKETSIPVHTGLTRQGEAETEPILRHQLSAVTKIQSLYVCMVKELPAAVASICEDGSIALPYVEEEFRNTTIAADLTAYLVNLFCEQGRSAFIYMSRNNSQGLKMLSDLRFNISRSEFTYFHN